MSIPRELNINDFNLEGIGTGTKNSFSLQFNHEYKEAGCIPVHVIKGKTKGKTLVVFAGVHGDEYEGIQTVIQAFQKLIPNDIAGTVILVPVANMSAYLSGNRESQIDDKNLARSFPGSSNGNYTSQLAWYLQKYLIAKADFFLDYHSGGTHYAMPPMVGYYDDPSSLCGRESKNAAEAFGMNVIWGHKETGPGRTLSSAVHYNIPWLYTEGYGGKRIRKEEQYLYENGLYRLMHFLNMILEPNKWISKTENQLQYRVQGHGNLDNAILAIDDGFFIPEVHLLQNVLSGDIIGKIYNIYGEVLQEIKAEQSGIVMMLRETPVTAKGDGLYLLGQLEK